MILTNPKYFQQRPVAFPWNDLKTINLGGARHYLDVNGNAHPSVTTVLSILSRGDISEWRRAVGAEEADRVSRRAVTRGTAVHDLVEKYLQNKLDSDLSKIMPLHLEGFLSIRQELDRAVDNVMNLECAVVSSIVRMGGRIDCVAEHAGEPAIIDFKTSGRFKSKKDITSYFLQMTAYSLMYEEVTSIPIKKLVVIMSVDSHKDPLVFIERPQKWYNKLIAVRKEYDKDRMFGRI